MMMDNVRWPLSFFSVPFPGNDHLIAIPRSKRDQSSQTKTIIKKIKLNVHVGYS